MFEPPRCPNRQCPHHAKPEGRFYVKRGFYKPLCRAHPVPRFRCRHCGRGFSRQTFRLSYRDHKPDRNLPLFLALASGLGLRQTARTIGLSLNCTQAKFRKIGRHCRRFNLNLRRELPSSTLVFDELETFEGRRGVRPLSVPILSERDSRYIIWA